MKKLFLILVILSLTVTLFGCGNGYVNKYSAKMMKTSCWGDEADMEYSDFKGVYHFKLKGNKDSDHTLEYDASLGEGEVNVYVGVDGEKELIFTIKGGESYDNTILLDDKYDYAKTIYVIVESENKSSNGDFEFEYN